MRQGVGKQGDYSAGILLDLTDLLKAWLHSARAADAVKYADTPTNSVYPDYCCSITGA